MKRTFKRIFAIALAAVVAFSMFTVGGFAKDKASTGDNAVFAVEVGLESDEFIEISLSLLSGSFSYFDLEAICPSGYTLKEIEKSESMKELIFSGNATMATNAENGKISFASIEPYACVEDYMFNFIYKKPQGESADVSDFTIHFSSLGEDDESYTAIVYYANSEELSVSVYPQSRELHYKDRDMLTVGITGSSIDCEVSFSSSNPKAVKVDENGNIYAAKRGSATITCTVTDEFGNTVSDSCNVNVKYSFGQWLIKILLFGWIWF